jgi:hypothetical protein
MDAVLTFINIVALVALPFALATLKRSIDGYAAEKGKNLATKEDVADITLLVESAKAEIKHHDRSVAKKYSLAYEACLEMLRILDAKISHKIERDNDGKLVEVDKQFATTDEIRSCHNKLLLVLDNPKVLELFLGVMTGESTNPIVDLSEIRALVREELGFQEFAYSDQKRTWIANSPIKRTL